MTNDAYRDFDRHSRKVGVRVFGWSITTVLAVLVLIALVGAVTYLWAPWKGEREQRMQTVGSGTYRIASYEWYFDQCNAVVASENKIDNFRKELKTTPKDDPQYAVLRAAILSQGTVRLDLIAEYNANAAKEETRAMFKDDGLPTQIDPEGETSCTV